MHEFLDIVGSFPTVVFAALSALVLLYWVFVMVGAVDIEMFDFDLDIDVPDIDVELEFEHEVEFDFEGAEGAGGDVDTEGLPLWAAALSALGVGKIPFMIVVSFYVLSSFVASYLVMSLFGAYLGQGVLVQAAVGVLAVLLAYPVTAFATRPFRKVFDTTRVSGGSALVGTICTVTTGSVTSTFGQAKIDDGAGLLLSVRSHTSNAMKRGSEAVIVEFDDDKNVYWVESVDLLMQGESKQISEAQINQASEVATRSANQRRNR